MVSPFVHKFRSDSGIGYVYDTNTNQILTVDDTVFDIVDDSCLGDYMKLRERWSGLYGEPALKAALADIAAVQEDGYFCGRPSVSMRGAACQGCIAEKRTQTQPQMLILEITESCNMRCRYCIFSGCYPQARRHSERTMDPTTARDAVSSFLRRTERLDLRMLSFYGGEPLTSLTEIREIVAFVERCSPSGQTQYAIATNGTLLTERAISFAVEHDVHLQVSLDGPRLLHDRYRVFKGGSGTHACVEDNLKSLRKRDPRYFRKNVSLVVTLAPPYDLHAVNAYFASEFPEHAQLQVAHVDDTDTSFFDEYLEGRRDWDSYRTQYLQLRTRYIEARVSGTQPSAFERGLFDQDLIRIHRRGIGRLDGVINANGTCVPGVRRCFVSVDGGYYPCERVMGAFRLGSVVEGFDDAAVCSAVERYVEASEADCARCVSMRLCALCFASSRHGARFSRASRQRRCPNELMRVHNALVTYCSILERAPHAFDYLNSERVI